MTRRWLVIGFSFFKNLICIIIILWFFFFFKQKTAYEMRIRDWSSDVCSSDLGGRGMGELLATMQALGPSGLFLRLRSSGAGCGLACGALTGCRARAVIGRASCRDRVWQYV